MKSILLLLLLSIGVYATWGDYIAPVIIKYFPREMVVANKNGDMLEISLIGRDEKNVYFYKEGDLNYHSYGIAQLSFLSRCKVKLYPRSSPKSITTKNKENDDPAQMHLAAMYTKYDDLRKQQQLLKIKQKTASNISTLESIENDIELLNFEINSIVYKVEDFLYRYPHLKRGTRKLEMIEIEMKEPDDINSTSNLFNLYGN